LPGLPVHRSRDLVNWELIGHVIDRPGQIDLSTVKDSGGLFAPTIRHDGTRFLLVCTLVGGTEGASGNFIVTADSAAGPWSDPIWWDMDGIDPSIMIDPDGSMWAHGTRLALFPEWEQQTEVWVRRLDNETLVPDTDETIVWSGALRGAIWSEGPHLFRRNGFVYLLAAEGGTSFHHAIVVARAESPLGPFTGNPANPVLTHRNLGRASPVTNVGHADLVEARDGSWWAVCLATRAWDRCDLLGRETLLVPVTWEYDWPVFAPGEGQLPQNPQGLQNLTGPEHLPADAANKPTAIGVEDVMAVRRHPSEILTEIQSSGTFRLQAGDGLTGASPAFLARRLTSLSTRVQIRLVNASEGVGSGLALRYSATAFIAVTVGRGTVSIETTSADAPAGSTHTPWLTLPQGAGKGVLGFEVHGTSAVAVWEPDDGEAVRSEVLDISHLCAENNGGFVGVTYGALATGDGGFADFADLQEGP
ncbi:MAG: family 43 glycosylhydrolase, partial [Pseudarthrobacter sp.]